MLRLHMLYFRFCTKGRLKTNALWGSSEDFLYGCDHYDEDIVDTDCEPDVEFEYDIEDEDKNGSTGENCSIGDNAKQNKKKKVMIDREELAGAHPWHLEANDESTDHEKGSEKNESQLKAEKNAGTKPSPIETRLVIEGGVG